MKKMRPYEPPKLKFKTFLKLQENQKNFDGSLGVNEDRVLARDEQGLTFHHDDEPPLKKAKRYKSSVITHKGFPVFPFSSFPISDFYQRLHS
jgi:hypothetical protein